MTNEHNASARGFDMGISTKASIEVASFVRGKDLAKAKALMENVIIKKVAVPFTKFNRDVGHKKGRIAAGRYPINVATEVLRLLNSAEKNAENKGLDVKALFVKSIVANKGTGTVRASRHRGRQAKRTHIEIILEEREKKVVKKKVVKKSEKETESK
mgnify:FL=1